jgi:hypothetical protein
VKLSTRKPGTTICYAFLFPEAYMQTGEDNNTPLERYLGITIRELRQRHGLTIAQALGVSLSTLFRNFDVPQGGAQLVKKGAGMEVVRKGTKRGHTYHLLAYDQGPRKLFEPFLITMEDEAERFPVFQHPGTEFIHMLKGVIEYRHGQQTYILHPGDTLTFQGEVPHGPERLIKTPIQFLSIFMYPQSGAD